MNPNITILQLSQTINPGRLNQILKRLSKEGRTPSDWVDASVKVAQALKTTCNKAEKLALELARNDVQILYRGGSNYPNHLITVLGDTAPPVLFAKGNLEILQQPAVGFTGSRKTSELGLNRTTSCASELATEGFNIVSGYANGSDLAAHKGALVAGGVTTLVLAEGILGFRIKPGLADWFDQNNCLVVSEFSPRSP